MEARGRRLLLLVAGAVAVWYLVVMFSWAVRPLHDSIPIGRNKASQPVSQDVTCNTLFAGSAHDGPLPYLDLQLPLKGPQYAYQRGACSLVQKDARIVFALDTLGAAVVIGGLSFVALRKPKEVAAPVAHTTYA